MARLRQIDDRQTAKPKASARFVKNQFARIVRTTMRHYIAHRSQQLALDVAARCSVFPNSADSTHFQISDLKFEIQNSRISDFVSEARPRGPQPGSPAG